MDDLVKNDLLETEIAFPIFRISGTWMVDGDGDKAGKRVSDGSSFRVMLPVGATIADANQIALEWWESMPDHVNRFSGVALRTRNPELVLLSATFVRFDTWVLTWFQHESRNVHLTDDQLRISFGRFVDRTGRQNIANGHGRFDMIYDESRKRGPFECVMGAEDRWRWKGPCRCEHCRAKGVVRIDH